MRQGTNAYKSLYDSAAFKPLALTTIMQDIVPPDLDMTLQESLFPFESFEDEEMLLLIKNIQGGLMAPYFKDGNYNRINLSGGQYIDIQSSDYWAEQVVFNHDDLENAHDPEKPRQLVKASALATSALTELKLRLYNRILWIVAKYTWDNTWTIESNGKYESRTNPIPDNLRLDLNDSEATGYTDVRDLPDSVAWTPTELWDVEATATPLTDLGELNKYLKAAYGVAITDAYIPSKIAGYLMNNANIGSILSDHQARMFNGKGVQSTLETIFNISKDGIKPHVLDSEYRFTTKTTDASTSGDGTFEVEDASELEDNDLIHIRNSRSRTIEINEVDSTSGNTVTLNNNLSADIASGSTVVVNKKLIPDDRIILKTSKTKPQLFAKIKTILGNKNQLTDGEFAFSYASPDPARPRLDVTAGIHGGPIIKDAGGFATLRVT